MTPKPESAFPKFPTSKVERPASEKEARKRLDTLTKHLSEIPYASAELRFAQQAISEFLDGKYQSLDRALGIRKGPGKPEQPPGKHLDLALRILEKLDGKRTWAQICDELRALPEFQDNPVLDDPDYVSKLYARYTPQVAKIISDEIRARLDKDAEQRKKAKIRAGQRATKKMNAQQSKGRAGH